MEDGYLFARGESVLLAVVVIALKYLARGFYQLRFLFEVLFVFSFPSNTKKAVGVMLTAFFCDPGEARTLDPMIKSHLLYQLSYGVIVFV